jgi:hypothetical protein
MLDFFFPHFIQPLPTTLLETISATISPRNRRAAEWFSWMLSLAPQVTSLHWQGPAIVAQWGVLTHLSLVVDSFGPERLEDVLAAAINLHYLRLVLINGGPFGAPPHFRLPRSCHILPTVITFNFSGETCLTLYLTLPDLTHLVMEQWMGMTHNPTDIEDFLTRSQYCINSVGNLARPLYRTTPRWNADYGASGVITTTQTL